MQADGTTIPGESIILEEEIDEDYEPTMKKY